jgi:hypothetical protein
MAAATGGELMTPTTVRQPETTVIPAIHEAGHAVVAAYLHCPFTHVTIRDSRSLGLKNGERHAGYMRASKQPCVRAFSYSKKTDSFRSKTHEEIQAELKRQCRNRALSIVGARAAIDEIFGRNCFDTIEDTYEQDEVDLKTIAELLEIPLDDFESWRALLLAETRLIVRLPFVKSAICDVAADLQIVLSKGRGLSAKHVRDVLKTRKEVTQLENCLPTVRRTNRYTYNRVRGET